MDSGTHGILVQSLGGQGGAGGKGEAVAGEAVGGNGGPGGNAGDVTVTSGGGVATISMTSATNSQSGIRIESIAGNGGKGGDGDGETIDVSKGGDGGKGGNGGNVNAEIAANISTAGSSSNGIIARSYGGAGGDGGNSTAPIGGGHGGSAAGAGPAGAVTLDFTGTITTAGNESNGILVQSIGGFAGDGGGASGFVSYGGGSESAGDGGTAQVTLNSGTQINTGGDYAYALQAQSVGGGGGRGGSAGGVAALGGSGSAGGNGGSVTVSTASGVSLSTTGKYATGLYAASNGGGGGDGGAAIGVVSIGGQGGSGGSGGKVTVDHAASIDTSGDYATGLLVQSVGGGGGTAHNTFGALTTIGGSGGQGGNGGDVSLTNAGTVTTTGDYADAIFVQSVGGGGGKGSNSGSLNTGISMTFGGTGGDGGDGGSVLYTDAGAAGRTISTTGDQSRGVFLQSVGGGGGAGGTTVSIAPIDLTDVGVTMGGTGGNGGHGGTVQYLNGTANISTEGKFSEAILAQSLGGGGGHGGMAVNVTGASLVSLTSTIGGNGGGGGTAAAVTVSGSGKLSTSDDHSDGIKAQSVGGGGGHGGMAISGSTVTALSINTSIGGQGGTGATADKVSVTWSGDISTTGDHSKGILAHSTGGGGGTAGTSVSASVFSTGGSINVGIGGNGGDGGTGSDVTVKQQSGTITTAGAHAAGILAHSIGGNGGSGNHAGTVQVSATNVTTTGHASAAIEAISTGGGGGSAQLTAALTGSSSQSVNVAVGGKGGAGGDGNTVTVELDGTLSTAGDESDGIRAISVGGGGGAGSLTMTGQISGGIPIGVGVGGNGGVGGAGGDVSVSTSANSTIYTTGALSEGILAMSVGGSGGSSGFVASANLFAGANANVDINGHGGNGGNAGTVTVNNQGNIIIEGMASSGIEASSIGGGGGNAKGVVNASALSMGTAAVSVGGSGGDGGKGGNVNVTSTGSIETYEVFSMGILAQSIGGGGGHGSFIAQASATGGEYSGEVGVSIGGSGGNGGAGGDVTVTTDGSISTYDFGGIGILAQSIGGNGGTGGSVYSGTISASSDGSLTASVDLGGNGGKGAKGGSTSVSNAATIETQGFYSDGILTQSIGGNGGKAGSAYSVLVTGQQGNAFNIDVNIGGEGGDGADAGAVTVNNTGDITAYLGGSDGIAAMSIGGGGGKGGKAANINVSPLPGDSDDNTTQYNVTANVDVGGKGGSGGNGSTVKVTNQALINTFDDYSRGIFAASIGGGGGDGGSTSSTSFSFNGICQMVSDNTDYECKPSQGSSEDKTTKVSLSLTASVGGNGGAAGDGGDVSVEHDGAILTFGDLSHGIAAMSIGGGGGSGGNGALGISAWTNNDAANTFASLPGAFTFMPNFNNVTVNVGGSEGASGHGGSVTITGTGSIITTGDQAYGINAQSIGGGGGTGGAGAGGVWAAVTVGGFGSGGGDGGDVTVDLSGGIETSGKGSVGIFAQSVGGGGGAAGDVETGWSQKWENLNIGAGLVVQNAAGGGGDGGKITITTGPITTTGQDAHGILAQSTGGSGGIASVSGSIAQPGSMFVAGSAGDLGNGGDISITNNGAIKVSGSGAHGIIAQSTAGSTTIPTTDSAADQTSDDSDDQKNTAGNISINVNADVIASGEDGRAILAQSQGATNGTISITVAEGATVATSASGAETIGLFDGNNNSLMNFGTIRHEGADPDDYVIRTNGSGLTVQNYGVIEGSILSKATNDSDPNGPIIFVNLEGGVLGLGGTISLGNGGTLTNVGTMSAGTVGTIGSSEITAVVSQTSQGTIVVDFAPGGSNDLITITSGSSAPEFDGTVMPATQGTVGSKSGKMTIIASQSGIGSNSLTVANTATVEYSLSQTSMSGGGEAIELSYDIGYTPWVNNSGRVPKSVTPTITQNHTTFGAHLDELLLFRLDQVNNDTQAFIVNAAEASDDYSFIDSLLHTVHRIETFEELLEFYSGFVPTELFAPAEATVHSALRFSGGLQDCPGLALGGLRFANSDYCGWFQITGAHNKRDSGQYYLSYTANDIGMFGGLQFEFAQDWYASVALGLEASHIDARRFSAHGPRFHAGLGLKREIGATSIGATVSAGFGSFDITRLVTTPEGEAVHTGDPNLGWISAMAHLSHTFPLGDTAYVKPRLDAGILHLHQSSYREQQADLYGLTVGSLNHTVGIINPSIEFGASFNAGNMPVEGSIKAGLLAFVGDKDWSTELRLNGLPEEGPSYTITDKRQRLFGTLGASLKVGLTENASFEVSGSALFNGDQRQFSGGARLSVRF